MKRVSIIGKVTRFGHEGKYLCLKLPNGNPIDRDHVWITNSKRVKRKDIKIGDVVSFTAQVDKYYGIDDKTDDLFEKNRLKHVRSVNVIKNWERVNNEKKT
jgi:hypothetical protein